LTSRRTGAGLTVIETLIAATLFLTAVVVLVGLFPTAVRATRQAQGHLMAVNLAERELEISRVQDFDALEDRSATYVLNVENNGASNDITFNTQVAVTTVRPGLKRIEVTIDYLGPDYFNRTLKMESYAADFNP